MHAFALIIISFFFVVVDKIFVFRAAQSYYIEQFDLTMRGRARESADGFWDDKSSARRVFVVVLSKWHELIGAFRHLYATWLTTLCGDARNIPSSCVFHPKIHVWTHRRLACGIAPNRVFHIFRDEYETKRTILRNNCTLIISVPFIHILYGISTATDAIMRNLNVL